MRKLLYNNQKEFIMMGVTLKGKIGYLSQALVILISVIFFNFAGVKAAAEELQTETPRIQENNKQDCEEGYYRLDDKCVKLIVPENAYVSGNEWRCKPGYKRQDDKCVQLKPEDLAPLFNDTKKPREYYVSGFSAGGYVYGYAEVYDNKGVSGYLYRPDGSRTYFYGEWAGKGVINAYDYNKNYYELVVEY